jgi:GntR family transcriptional regulator/MocR family aminotransferase
MRYRQPLTFPVSLNRDEVRPLGDQLAEQICTAVDQGMLPPGMRMPSTRTLAALVGVSRGVTMEAYELLLQRGYAASRPGSGTYVTVPARMVATTGSGTVPAAAGRHPARLTHPPRPAGRGRTRSFERADGGDPHGGPHGGAHASGHGGGCGGGCGGGGRGGGGYGGGGPGPGQSGGLDLRPGQVSGAVLPLAAWRAAWRWASFRPPPTGPLPPLGLPELRHAIGRHVQRTHGVSLAGREVVVTAGTADGLRALLAALGAAGPEVAVEEPIAPALWRAAEGGGGRPVAVAADREGARVEEVPDRCRALVLCPDAGVPSGAVLSAGRRAAAARWSGRPGTCLVEVACGAMFPPAAQRLPRLLSLAAPDAAALVGGFCEVLTPALGIGYAVVPAHLAEAVGRHIADRSGQPPYVSQLAVARLLREGTVERVMHRLDRDHRRRGQLVRAALGATGRPAPVLGATGTALLALPGGDAEAVAAGLRTRGVRVATLQPYYFSAAPVPAALVLGYGHLTEAALCQGLALLSRALPTA